MLSSSEVTADAVFPGSQRANLLQSLVDDLTKISDEENVSLPKAFSTLALSWLGEEAEGVEYIVDGAGDRGVDAYRISPESVVLYQFKGRAALDFEEILRPGGVDLISDVSRVISLLSGTTPIEAANSGTQRLINKLRSYLKIYSEAESLTSEDGNRTVDTPVLTLRLAVLSDGLTKQAQEELDRIKKQNGVIVVFGVESLFEIEIVTINEFLAQKWRKSNTAWKDSSGKKNETIRLSVEGQKIKDKTSMIFYTKAIDLITAFNNFGYQLFEPNVRCQITRSRVNREISKQVDTEKGIQYFKDLNNGVTLVYASFSERDRQVTLTKPGIVNGLQTVTTLATKYNSMPEKIRNYFDQNCHILVRLYGKSAVNVPTLVKATNNQNPMEPRNLRSNDPEQILLEQRFAELGWFYERKDYAWEAFTSDESSWPTLKNANKRSFQVQSGQSGRPAIRRIDNQDVAQSWLAFTGYANEAVQRKRELFVEEKFYDHAFKNRPLKHGSDYDFSFAEAQKEVGAIGEAPLAEALLLACLCDHVSRTLTPSGRQHREACIQRLKLSGRKREEQDSILNNDAQYLAGLIRTSASMLFTEVVGFILFRALGKDFYRMTPEILRATDLSNVYQNFDVEPIKVICDKAAPNRRDLFSLLWLTFVYLTDSIADDISWRNSFFQQSSRPRFLYSIDMRRRLKTYVENFDARLQRKSVPLAWVGLLEEQGGLFAFAKSIISLSSASLPKKNK